MEVKYFSDDGHEFKSKHLCEKYEEALNEIENVNSLPMKEVDGKQWFRVSSLAEFYFFDHMDDNTRKKSNRDMYAISQIVEKINHYFPYWITKDFEEGIMIDKKRVDVIDDSINYLKEEIDNLREEKKELEKLRNVEVTDEDYKTIMDIGNDVNNGTTKKVQEVEETNKNNEKNQPILGTNKYDDRLNVDGLEFDLSDVVAIAQDESGLSIKEWNELSQQERNNHIDEQIQILKNV